MSAPGDAGHNGAHGAGHGGGHGGGQHAATSGAQEGTRSLGEIVGAVTSDLGDLFRQEVELAKTELRQEAKRAGKGAGVLAAAGIAAVLLLVFASLTLMWALDDALPRTAAAAIVAGLWLVVTAVLALVGRTSIKESDLQLPTTQQTLKEDASWARHQTS